MKTIALMVLLAAAGCSKQGSDCDASIAKGIESVTETVKAGAANPQMQQNRIATMAKLKTTLTQRCGEDKWAGEVVQCFSTVKSMKDMQECQGKLNTEQRTKLLTEVRQIMLDSRGPRMPEGVPGHPPTLTGSAGSGNSAGGPDGSAAPPAPAPGGPAAPAPSGSASPPAAPAPAQPAAGSGSK